MSVPIAEIPIWPTLLDTCFWILLSIYDLFFFENHYSVKEREREVRFDDLEKNSAAEIDVGPGHPDNAIPIGIIK